MKLNQISDNRLSQRPPKRVGRGSGSGYGKTCGRGNKGQKSRAGVSLAGFEGGQMPINRRLPKRGFTNIFRKRYAVVNTGRLQKAVDAKKLDASQPIDSTALVASGLVTRPGDGIRLLGDGEISTAITLHVAGASAKAKQAIEAKGGKLVLTATPRQQANSGVQSQVNSQEKSGADSQAKSGAKSQAKPAAESKPESPATTPSSTGDK